MKRTFTLLLIPLALIILFSTLLPIASADYVSINSGGDTTMMIHPEENIEGLFGPGTQAGGAASSGGGTAPLSPLLSVTGDPRDRIIAYAAIGLLLFAILVGILVNRRRRR